MKIGALQPHSSFGLDAHSEAQKAQTQETEATERAARPGEASPLDPEKLRLAREFEQIFIRKMLSSLEKSGRNSAGSSSSASGDAYGSMVVSALAEAVSKGGGVGLAEMIARAASQPTASGPSANARTTHAIQAAIAGATHGAAGAPTAPTLGPAASSITVPHNVQISVAAPPPTATYPRPSPAVILNQNNDIRDSFKDSNR